MTDLARYAADHGLRHFLFSFSDLFGVQRAKLVPASAVDQLARDGAGFAGFAAWLAMTPADPDVLGMPDPASLAVLPWQRNVAWVATDLQVEGRPLEQSPRWVLRRQLERATQLGYSFRTGVEAEFFLLQPGGTAIADVHDTQSKPCYDQLALMRQFELIGGLLEAMEELGWGPYQADHEDANGQFEINWTFADALVTADRHALFRVMAQSMAEPLGARVSFGPKPFPQLTGSGAHLHHSLWDDLGPQPLPRPPRRAGSLAAGLPLSGGAAGARPGPVRHHQSHRRELRTPGGPDHQLRRHLVTGLDQLRRQQPQPHGAHPRRPAPGAAPGRQCRQPLPAAGGGAGRRPRRP